MSMLMSRRMAIVSGATLWLARGAAAQAPPSAAVPPRPQSLIRLDSNENAYGPSPKARAAVLGCIDEACRYPDAAEDELSAALASLAGVKPEHVVLGTGSGELLHMAGAIFAEGGGEIVAPHPTFEQLPRYAEKFGGRITRVPLDADLRADLSAMRAAVSAATRLVYLCNPNNPSGTGRSATELREFLRGLPEATVALVDEAYIDLTDDPAITTVADLARERANVLVLRTFSKTHGLAGLRVGYAIAQPALAARLRSRQMTTLNVAGVRAALASLEDEPHHRTIRARLIADRARILARLDELGLRHAQALGNFVFFDTGMPLPDFRRGMRERGISIARPFAPYSTWTRISVGTTTETDALLAALPVVLQARKAA